MKKSSGVGVSSSQEIEKYGVTFCKGFTEANIELAMAFDVNGGGVSLHTASGFLGAFEHLRRAIDLIWNREGPRFIWNDWSETLLRAFIENREIPVSGPAASGKSTCSAIYALCFWMANPLQSKVIISSTTLGGLRERIWKDILSFYHAAQPGFGNVIQHPTPKIQSQKGDDSMGFFGVAVEQGDLNKAIDKIKGRHAPNVLVVIDEGTGAQQAIVDACVNLETGCDRFQMIMLANPSSYFDQHGRLSESENGWGSISVNDETWKTKRGGVAIHLDGLKSPNVLAGFKKYPGLISQEDLDTAARRDGDNSPRFWQERRGFWPPEGVQGTILSDVIIEKFKAREKPTWLGEPLIVGAALDPAYEGGDRKILKFAKCGKAVDDKIVRTVLFFTETINLKVDVTSKEPIHYQIVRQTREACEERGVEPEYFAMDSTGEGGGVAAIFKREWSQDFLEVEFGGNATNRRISDINPRPGHEEYANRVSELWYQFRSAVERYQIRGLDNETCQEFCQRKYDMQGIRRCVESKSKMKGRSGRSPDLADAAVVMLELFLHRGLMFRDSGSEITTNRTTNWVEFAKKMSPRNQYATAT